MDTYTMSAKELFDTMIGVLGGNDDLKELNNIFKMHCQFLTFSLFSTQEHYDKRHTEFFKFMFDFNLEHPWQINSFITSDTFVQKKSRFIINPEHFKFFSQIDDALKSKGVTNSLGQSAIQCVEVVGTAACQICDNKAVIELLNSHISKIKEIMDSERKSIVNSEKLPSTVTMESIHRDVVTELLEELNELVGLHQLKESVNDIINIIRVRNLRMERNLPVAPMSFHLVFTGNPGTGKTTVARQIAKIYKEFNLLSKGHLVEVDRSGLVAGYIGQTALKVQEVVQSAIGGVLFIDEAYSLASGNDGIDYGREAIDTLLKLMEDFRHDLVVITAGYPDRMEHFLESNPGLRSRFNRFVHFQDYSADELLLIFSQFCTKTGYILTEEAESKLRTTFNSLISVKDETFGNARTVRNIFEQMLTHNANRIVKISNPTETDLSTITIEDIK
ncbi:AAA family ATPase [Paenibacillus sp. LjRoot153]|uniref:AAA family ATPase n=1 Tax=Paenibacillus sp. LjRoot153 TaxID=3342270 RepID=UPI003ECEAF29